MVGRFQDQVQRMIEIYSPDSLIVGTRGRDGAIGGLLPGSMSKYCLQHSPIPVIVVHPSQRRLHRKQKREKDPERQSYISLLKLANAYTSSSDSLSVVTSSMTTDAIIPEITLDTPDSPSPGEEMLQYVGSDPQLHSHFVEADLTAAGVGLKHAYTIPLTAAEEASMERQRENLSPKDTG